MAHNTDWLDPVTMRALEPGRAELSERSHATRNSSVFAGSEIRSASGQMIPYGRAWENGEVSDGAIVFWHE